MNYPEKRTCPFCAEGIKAEAKLCPHCRQWLTLRSFRHPVISTLAFGIPGLVFLLSMFWVLFSACERLANPKPYYSEFPESLKVLESRMNWAQTSNGLRIYLAGVLTNTSPIAWRAEEYDCRFFDAHGVMVDASTGYGRCTVGPHDDAAFRVSIEPTALTNNYSSFTISVSHARNTKSWF
jgi:hypothetical protein